MLTALVIEDEPLARRRLAELLAAVPWVTQIGEASDGLLGIEAVRRLRPDVALVDIEMPEVGGLELVRHLRALADPPAVIFTTAYDRYAVAAFELQAVDYLLKPFGAARLLAALERVRALAETRVRIAALDRADAALCGPARTLERVFVREGLTVRPLPVREIVRVEAQDDYAALHTLQRSYLVGLRISELEASLPNPPFMRVHRSHIVNLDHVECIAGLDGARLEVRCRNGARVPVSRARARELRALSR